MDLCPAEFRAMVRGRHLVVTEQRELAAWMVAHLMNIHGKRLRQPITVAKLLGRVVRSTRKDEEEE
jgi:hypothetical protein